MKSPWPPKPIAFGFGSENYFKNTRNPNACLKICYTSRNLENETLEKTRAEKIIEIRFSWKPWICEQYLPTKTWKENIGISSRFSDLSTTDISLRRHTPQRLIGNRRFPRQGRVGLWERVDGSLSQIDWWGRMVTPSHLTQCHSPTQRQKSMNTFH